MKNYKLFFLLALLFGTILTSCSDEHKAYRDLKTLAKDIHNNSETYSTGDWYAAWKDYQDVNERINKNYSKYTLEEKKDIEHYRSICIGGFTNAAINTGADLFEKGKNTMQDVMDWWNRVNN